MGDDNSSIIIPRDDNEKSIEVAFTQEIKRIRSSASFRIGTHIVKAIQKPWRLLLIWFTLPLLMWRIALENFGMKKRENYVAEFPMIHENNKSILLFPTNGVGIGHFTRMLAIARKLREFDDNLEIVFFTTMPTLQILTEEGFPAYHLSGHSHFDDMDTRTWNIIVEEMLLNIIATHRPEAFIFDGAFPYRGMLNAIKNNENILKVWINKRGLENKNGEILIDEKSEQFDVVVKPLEFSNKHYEKKYEKVRALTIPPVTLVNKEELKNRNVLRQRLGVPKDCVLVYIQLGAGKINEINSDIKLSLDILLSFEHVYVVIGESIIGDRINFNDNRVRSLRDYPNSIYFNSFDFAIIAGGYNSIHETILFNLPTICYPNLQTGNDDQLSRATIAQEAGCTIMVVNRNHSNITDAINHLMNKETREEMARRASLLKNEDGAQFFSKWVINELKLKK